MFRWLLKVDATALSLRVIRVMRQSRRSQPAGKSHEGRVSPRAMPVHDSQTDKGRHSPGLGTLKA